MRDGVSGFPATPPLALSRTIGGAEPHDWVVLRASNTHFLRSAGTVERVGIEGTGSYGAGVTRVLSAEGFNVAEVARPNRRSRRLRGKSDPLDAKQAALNVLAHADTSVPKSGGGTVEVLQMLLAERRSASKAGAQVMNQIHALLVTAPDTVREGYRRLGPIVLVGVLARSRPRTGTGPEYVARQVLKRLAVRHVGLTAEIAVIEQEMSPLIIAANPTLISLNGVGPVTAATLMVAAGGIFQVKRYQGELGGR